MVSKENKNLIYIPKDANYIEILGHRIDGFESFEAFCEHLKKYAELEDTVERQKEENERLKGIKTTDWLVKGISKEQLQEEKIQALTEEINRLQAENERLESLSERLGDDVNWKADYIYELEDNLKTAKAEAYKEFAERVKDIDLYQFIEEYYQNAELRYEVRRDWFDEHIDNLLKEKIGETK